MADTSVEIPDRDFFKASEVCEIASVQPYVLRSWEQEFPSLGVARSTGGARIYRRPDVERVLRIKQLVFVEGLTLAGARRRLEGDDTANGEPAVPAIVDGETRQKLDGIKQELRSLLALLNGGRSTGEPARWPPRAQPTLLEFDGGARHGDAANGDGKAPGARKRAPRGK